MPTGIGKSLTLLLCAYALGANRVLVIAPQVLVRGQLAETFASTVRLRTAGVLQEGSPRPQVKVLRKKATSEDWEAARSFDVVVATPQVASPLSEGVAPFPLDLFDLVLFDEAHHLPAQTWDGIFGAVRERATVVMTTATPFRRDGKRLPGDIVFSYPLSRAIDDGVYAPVSYVPLDAAPGEDRDRALAQTAIARLNDPAHVEAQSKLLVRTDSKEAAKVLHDLYEGLGVRLGVVTSDYAATTVARTMEQLSDGDLRGLVCVGALTEGFDFPTLKIAAYHAPHKSLAPTLQFIGRLSRVTGINGELVANRGDISKDTAGLYRGETDWRKLVPDLVDSAVDHEREVRAFISEAEVGGSLDLSELALNPSRSAHVYRLVEPPVWDVPLSVARAPVVKSVLNSDAHLLALITQRPERPRFLRHDHLDVLLHDLHVVVWVETPGLLFVNTQKQAGVLDLLDKLELRARARRISASDLERLLDAAQLERCFSIGTRPALPGQAGRTSYRMSAGAQVEDDARPMDGRSASLGHVMGREGGQQGTFGLSVAKGKIWEAKDADSLLGFRDWCEGLANTLAGAAPARQSGKLDYLSISDAYQEFPANPIVAVLPFDALSEHGIRISGEVTLPERVETEVERVDGGQIRFRFKAPAGASASIIQTASPLQFIVEAGEMEMVDQAGELTPATELLAEHSPTVIFGGGEQVVGSTIQRPAAFPTPLTEQARVVADWTDVDKSKEFEAPAPGKINVAAATERMLASNYDFVIQDHLPGELADFIAIASIDSGVKVVLAHCKSAGGTQAAQRTGDVQELVAQTLRSTVWMRPGGGFFAEVARRIRERNPTTMKVGTEEAALSQLLEWSDTPPRVFWEVWAVQPGVSNARLDGSSPLTPLFAPAYSSCREVDADFKLVCSE
jgi:superfamily II DNA or RNA helicase